MASRRPTPDVNANSRTVELSSSPLPARGRPTPAGRTLGVLTVAAVDGSGAKRQLVGATGTGSVNYRLFKAINDLSGNSLTR